ncbi:MAG: hypothetical protein J6J24_00185 [Clostridia bacterium]|nr:hypothetical protein [Clostridia bacterium]
MSLFKRTKMTEEQKSALKLMRTSYNKGIEEKELGSFHERFNQFSEAKEHYRLAYNYFSAAEEMAELSGDDRTLDKIVAYKGITSAKSSEMDSYINSGFHNRTR